MFKIRFILLWFWFVMLRLCLVMLNRVQVFVYLKLINRLTWVYVYVDRFQDWLDYWYDIDWLNNWIDQLMFIRLLLMYQCLYEWLLGFIEIMLRLCVFCIIIVKNVCFIYIWFINCNLFMGCSLLLCLCSLILLIGIIRIYLSKVIDFHVHSNLSFLKSILHIFELFFELHSLSIIIVLWKYQLQQCCLSAVA